MGRPRGTGTPFLAVDKVLKGPYRVSLPREITRQSWERKGIRLENKYKS